MKIEQPRIFEEDDDEIMGAYPALRDQRVPEKVSRSWRRLADGTGVDLPGYEARSAPRVAFLARGTLASDWTQEGPTPGSYDQLVTVSSSDISTSGALVTGPQVFRTGQHVLLRIAAHDGSAFLSLRGCIARYVGAETGKHARFGIEFLQNDVQPLARFLSQAHWNLECEDAAVIVSQRPLEILWWANCLPKTVRRLKVTSRDLEVLAAVRYLSGISEVHSLSLPAIPFDLEV
jgi:hypothetical protein